MKNFIVILILSLVSANSATSQKIVKELKEYDYVYVNKIFIDSLFIKEITTSHCKSFYKKRKKYAKFTIIPVVRFIDDFNYLPGTSILNYITIDTTYITGLLSYKNNVLGRVSAYLTNAIFPKMSDNILDYKIIPLRDLEYGNNYSWYESPETDLCRQDAINLAEKIINLIKKEKPDFYFMFGPSQIDFFWFFKDGKLKVYSRFEDKIFEEKDLVIKIKKIPAKNFSTGKVIDGKFEYYIMYK